MDLDGLCEDFQGGVGSSTSKNLFSYIVLFNYLIIRRNRQYLFLCKIRAILRKPDDTASATDVHEILVPRAKSRQLPARYFAILL